MSDKKLAREFVKKVGPLEHSPNKKDRMRARKYERQLRHLNAKIPKRMKA